MGAQHGSVSKHLEAHGSASSLCDVHGGVARTTVTTSWSFGPYLGFLSVLVNRVSLLLYDYASCLRGKKKAQLIFTTPASPQ